MKKITILKKLALLCVLLPISFSLPSCSNSDDDAKTPTNEKGSGSTGGEKGPSLTEEETTTINGIDVPVSDKDKSSANLISEAYTALNAGDYNKTLSKFRSAYAKEQTDETKIYYALTELALLSTDKTVADIIKNDLGITDYPATPNAIFNTSWFKNYPKYESISAERFEKNSTGSYIRVSATPTDSYSSSNLYPWNAYALYDGDWVQYYAYSSMMKEGYYLSNIVPDSNGKYLIPVSDYYSYGITDKTTYTTQAEEEIKDYLCDYDGTKSQSGSYVRLTGTETTSYSSDYIYYSRKYTNGTWTSNYGYLNDYTLSNEGIYLAYKYNLISNHAANLLKQEYSSYLYNMSSSHYRKSLLGKAVYVPELAIPEWVKSTDYYQDSLVKTTQTYKTWLYLLYANVVTNCDNGFNNTIDKLLSVIHSKTETIKAIVDSLGTGTATLDAEFIANLKLTKILGEDPVDFGKPEMNVLTAALEACDAVFNFAASYDFSANLKAAEVDFDSDFYVKRDADKILNIVNDCVTSSTLSVRDASKLTTSKTLLSSALTRLISTYNDIKNSNNYPQAAKDKIDEYGPFLLDGATKAKAALNNGTVFYLPQNPKANTFPTSASDAAFGIDFGKIFTPGYFTDIIKRSSDKEKIKIYYKRYEDSYSYSSENGYKTVKSESDPTEIETTIEEFVKTIASDAENYSYSSSSSSYSYGRTRIWYDIGIMADRDIITNALTGIANTQRNSAIVDKMRFIKLFTINSIK